MGGQVNQSEEKHILSSVEERDIFKKKKKM